MKAESVSSKKVNKARANKAKLMLDNNNAKSRQWLIPTKDFDSEANTSSESIKKIFAPAKKKHVEKAKVKAP